MPEETNLTEETKVEAAEETTEDLDFADLFEEEEMLVEKADRVLEQEDSVLPIERPSQATEIITAKYNGKEIPLDKKAVESTAQALGVTSQEYVAMLQKGMNYDHVAQELQGLRQAKEFQILDYYAKQAGMSRADYIGFLENQKEQILVQQEQNQLLQKYPDSDPALLQEIAQANAKNKLREVQEQELKARKEAEEQARRPWIEFFKEYPDIELTAIPAEVFQRVNRGEHPIQAMQRVELQKLQQQMQTLQNNAKNKITDTGSVRSNAAPETDDFLAGFLA